jgi:DNA-binding transcriptional LysR family regulator
MELLQIKYFMKVAATGNIARTAAIFRVPPSSVSVAIKKLEDELQVKLFDRSANKIKLNASGKALLNVLENAEFEFKKATTDLLTQSKGVTGLIKMLVLTNRRSILDLTAKLKQEHPDIDLAIQHEDYLEYGRYHEFDIVISDRNINHELFDRIPFLREEIFLAVSAGDPLSERATVGFSDIIGEKVVCEHRGSSMRDLMDGFYKKHKATPLITVETEDPYHICEYVKAGLGVTFFPYLSWRKQIDERLRLIRIDNGLYRDTYVYYKKENSDAVKVFLNMLERQI